MSKKVKNTFESFQSLRHHDESSQVCIATYLWIDAILSLRCKSRVLQNFVNKPEDAPLWNFDGSSTEQAKGMNSDCWLKPVAVFAGMILVIIE